MTGENRLVRRVAAARASERIGLAPYVTAGDGGLDDTLAVLRALDAAGATCVELGVPFSDPVADGPVLQAAADRALAAGTTLNGILAMVRQLRSGDAEHAPSELPIALFSYANPLVRHGWRTAARNAREAGVDALLVPDLPIEESAEMHAAALAYDLCPIFFVAPTTGDERIQRAGELSRGFVYAIGRLGITGRETVIDDASRSLTARIRALTDRPIAVGFGLRNRDQVECLQGHADLAVVGSALVAELHAARTAGALASDRAARFVAALSNDPAEAPRP